MVRINFFVALRRISGRDTSCKIWIRKPIGSTSLEEFVCVMGRSWFCRKTTKEEFDREARLLMGPDIVHLHNQVLHLYPLLWIRICTIFSAPDPHCGYGFGFKSGSSRCFGHHMKNYLDKQF